MDKFETEVKGMGFNVSGYPGAFTPVVEKIIKQTIYGKVLHLYSGQSTIGDERIDLARPEATINGLVEDFVSQDERDWDWVVLDPPYLVRTNRKHGGKKTSLESSYGSASALAACVQARKVLIPYLQKHTKNILWLDTCAPLPKGFKRKKIWFLFPGGYHPIRALSWLENKLFGQSKLAD